MVATHTDLSLAKEKQETASVWEEVWTWLSEHVAILAALLTFALTVGWQAITRWLAPRPKLIYGMPQSNSFLVPYSPAATEEEPHPVRQVTRYLTRSVLVQNLGSSIAEEVEIVFNWVPQHLEHFPRVPITRVEDESGRLIVTIPRVNPKEVLTFSMLSMNTDLPEVTYIRCKGFKGKFVAVQNSRVFSKWTNIAIAWLMLAGIAATVYILLQIAIWLWSVSASAF